MLPSHPRSARLTSPCCRCRPLRTGALPCPARCSKTATEIRPDGRMATCRLTTKAAAGATKAALVGISLVAVRNLMLRTIRATPSLGLQP
ncbi:hypothetical protein NXT3_PA00155 (plasmid) [Sinorhizobium fredii]|uniref:Uncharacterized protein n=1 Tax=Rhizobium fredii TaxID=380 RepID=A0A2L0HAK9_RHIFR|nr:hypothetical protein NXT3_PA00155 [Sinorhizobium fredii]